MSRTIALCSAIALPEGTVPDWVHLLPADTVTTMDGRGPYTVPDAQAVISKSIAAGKLPLDESHATDLAAPKGGAAPARGWIVELQQRPDGIWGRVEWTPIGRRMMEEREYRGVSPVIQHGKDGVISAILRASLTNTPNLSGLTSLHSQDATKRTEGQLDADDLEMIRKLGVDPQEYLAQKKADQAKEKDAQKVALQSAGRIDADGLDDVDRAVIRSLGIDRAAYLQTRRA